jgi:hypothetical protein
MAQTLFVTLVVMVCTLVDQASKLVNDIIAAYQKICLKRQNWTNASRAPPIEIAYLRRLALIAAQR